MSLTAVPVKIAEACAFVRNFHRHNTPPVSGLFAVGASDGTQLVGVAIVGRPVARGLDDGETAEVVRCCVVEDAPKGACSFLYARCWQAAKALGWRRLVTYTLQSESGASLRGAGWRAGRAAASPRSERLAEPARTRVAPGCRAAKAPLGGSMKQTSTTQTDDRTAMDLLRRLVEWNDRGDCRSLSDFVEEARRLLAAAGVPVGGEGQPYCWINRDGGVPRVRFDAPHEINAHAWLPLFTAHESGVAIPEVPSSADAAWLKRIRDTAAHLRDNSLKLAKYPGMGDEARARELAALYIAEIADLHEAIAAAGVKEVDDAQR